MPPHLTIEQALALAPDASGAAAARKLAEPRNWDDLGHAGQALWGACRGSAKEPYRVGVDLDGPVFRCSCPSRKFPCKHALGLLLLLAGRPELLPATDPPVWIDEWLAARARAAERREKREQAQESPAETTTTPKAVSSSKSRSAREQKVDTGLIELERWLHDQMRAGLAALQSNTPAAFNALAARMIDAQAPGVARLLRAAAADTASGDGWQHRLLDRLARCICWPGLISSAKCSRPTYAPMSKPRSGLHCARTKCVVQPALWTAGQ
ncbi:MAG: hypothetical protein HC822_03610 [Oscillochloris sp.]|nr:hypothetical protein [Oscillochloris sp.]